MIKKIIKSIVPKRLMTSFIRIRTIYIMKRNTTNFDYKKIEKRINKQYYKINKMLIDWDNPRSYTEKLNFSKLYNPTTLKAKLSDKYEVREWVKEKIGDEYLIPLIGVYNDFSSINFNELPDNFVMKCNHDSGSVTICSDKSKLNYKNLKKDYDYYLKRNIALTNYELHYKDITSKIIIEKNMGNNICDYKFLCFDGNVYYCWVDFDRFSNHKRNVYDLNWNLQPFRQFYYDNCKDDIEKPKNFEKMVKIAKKLSQGFDHVRVDLYDINGKIYFGEMTFTNGNGMEPIIPHEYDIMLGNLWNLNLDNRKKVISK